MGYILITPIRSIWNIYIRLSNFEVLLPWTRFPQSNTALRNMWSGSKTFGATLAMHPPSNIPEPNTPSSLLSSTHVHVADHLHLCALWAPRFDKRASPQLSQGRSPDQQHRLWPTRTAILFWSPSCAWRSCCLSLVSCKLANGNTSCVVQQRA